MITIIAQRLQNPALPPQLGNIPILPAGAGPITIILGFVFRLMVIMGALLMIAQLLIGAINWITAEGKPEKLEHGRNAIINAVTGMIILAAAVAVTSLIGTALNIPFLQTLNINIPSL